MLQRKEVKMDKHVAPPSDLDIVRALYREGCITLEEAHIYIVHDVEPDESRQHGYKMSEEFANRPGVIDEIRGKVGEMVRKRRAALQVSPTHKEGVDEDRRFGPEKPGTKRAEKFRS